MKNIIDRAYARQREYSWRQLAGRFEGVGYLAIIAVIIAFLMVRWACG